MEKSSVRRLRWTELKTTEFAALPAETVAVLPVAAVEQHGPHLPVCVDACINEGLLELAIEKAHDLSILFLPIQVIGKSNEHMGFAGTLTLSTETLVRLWTEIGESVRRSGVRRMLIFNSHGGQPQVADIVARELRIRHEMFVAATSWWRPGGLEIHNQPAPENAGTEQRIRLRHSCWPPPSQQVESKSPRFGNPHS
jgi:creatinine amidohydrolase